MRELLLQGKFNDDDKKKIQAIVQDYELVEDIASLKNPSELEIVLGWSPDLTDFIQNEPHKIKYIQTTSAGVNSISMPFLTIFILFLLYIKQFLYPYQKNIF